jgi:hypothetical protein
MKVAISWKANTPYGLTEVYRRPTGSCYFHRRYHNHYHMQGIVCHEADRRRFVQSFPHQLFSSSTAPRWLVPPEVLQPAGLLYEPGFGSSRLSRQEPPRFQRC